MRANGVPAFPDPTAGGFPFRRGGAVDPSSPVFQAAQAACRKLMPGGGPRAPGSTTQPSRRWLDHMIRVAACMRRHGVGRFPDPTTTVPSLRGADGIVSDIDGAVFAFPSALDMQAPAFVRAAAACGFPLHNH